MTAQVQSIINRYLAAFKAANGWETTMTWKGGWFTIDSGRKMRASEILYAAESLEKRAERKAQEAKTAATQTFPLIVVDNVTVTSPVNQYTICQYLQRVEGDRLDLMKAAVNLINRLAQEPLFCTLPEFAAAVEAVKNAVK